jgi:hypothetical protein
MEVSMNTFRRRFASSVLGVGNLRHVTVTGEEKRAGFRACGSATLRDFAHSAHFDEQGRHHYFPQSITWTNASMLH